MRVRKSHIALPRQPTALEICAIVFSRRRGGITSDIPQRPRWRATYAALGMRIGGQTGGGGERVSSVRPVMSKTRRGKTLPLPSGRHPRERQARRMSEEEGLVTTACYRGRERAKSEVRGVCSESNGGCFHEKRHRRGRGGCLRHQG